MSTEPKRTCSSCGNELSGATEFCPVCALRQGLSREDESGESSFEETVSRKPDHPAQRFENYELVMGEDGKPIELGRGAMGVTYKAFDVDLRLPVALKLISEKYIGDQSARLRFLREARAAAKVRHSNVASVFHLGRIGQDYFYAMEFVEGETLEKLIRRSVRLDVDVALEIVAQVAAGLGAIQKQHLVHRDIKPSNVMVSLEQCRLENVKIIDLGLAKGVAEEDSFSTLGTFTGTPEYASPEQFAGVGTDIRSDLYSLGVSLWQMLVGKLPFEGSAAELMYQHQHAAPPIEKLKGIPSPVIALLEVLLAKDPGRRFQDPAQLQKAIPKVSAALASGSRLTCNDLRAVDDKITERSPKRRPMKQALGWLIAAGLCLVGLLLSWFFFLSYREAHFYQRTVESPSTEKSVAVLPFENISANKDDAYFADGVQDEILNDLGKVAQLKVISRTSVMKYRADTKRDLRQIANALGVANVLEGAVRRNGNLVRVSTELIDARTDDTIWADSYDRDLKDIFAIQSEVAQTIAAKLTATLSPQEKESIEAKPTENLAAYDFYLRGKELVATVSGAAGPGNVEKPLLDAVFSLEQAVRLDPKFTLAYCELARAHDLLCEFGYDLTPERRVLSDAAISSASGLQPDLPEVHLARAYHLYDNADYEQARVELTIARRRLPNDARAIMLEAMIDRLGGHWEKSIQKFNEAIAHDPRNAALLEGLAVSFLGIRQFRAAEQVYARLIELLPDQPTLKVAEAAISFSETGDDTAIWSAIAALPPSIANDSDVLAWRLCYALIDRNWAQAKELIDNMKGSVYYQFGYAWGPVPIGCFSILLARVQGEQPREDPGFAQAQTELKQNIQKPQPLPVSAQLLSSLAVVDALLGHREEAISEATRAVEMCPISKNAWSGPGLMINLAVVYAWTNELDLAFETLRPLTKTPWGIYYGDLKRDPYWEPLRKDARYEKLLAELAPRD